MATRKRPAKTMKRYAATRSPRGVIKQGAADLERGLEDTDCRAPHRRAAARKKS